MSVLLCKTTRGMITLTLTLKCWLCCDNSDRHKPLITSNNLWFIQLACDCFPPSKQLYNICKSSVLAACISDLHCNEDDRVLELCRFSSVKCTMMRYGVQIKPFWQVFPLFFTDQAHSVPQLHLFPEIHVHQVTWGLRNTLPTKTSRRQIEHWIF